MSFNYGGGDEQGFQVSRPDSIAHHKQTCIGLNLRMDTEKAILKEVGLHTQNVLTIVGSIVNLIEGDLYDHSIRETSL